MSNSKSVLRHEDQPAFDRLLESYRSEFLPATTHEQSLVDQLAQSRCRLNRARRLETLALDQIIDPAQSDETNPDSRIVAHLGHTALTTLNRWASAAEKSYYRAHRELTQARAREIRNKANDAQIWLKNGLEAIRNRPPVDSSILHGNDSPAPGAAPVQNEPNSTPTARVQNEPKPATLPRNHLSRRERRRQRTLSMAA